MAVQFWSLEVIPQGFCKIQLFPGPPKNAHWWDLSYLEGPHWHETSRARWKGARSGSGTEPPTTQVLFHLGLHNNPMAQILLFSFLLKMRTWGFGEVMNLAQGHKSKRWRFWHSKTVYPAFFSKINLTGSLHSKYDSPNEWARVSHTICPEGVVAPTPLGPNRAQLHRNVSVLSAGQLVPCSEGGGSPRWAIKGSWVLLQEAASTLIKAKRAGIWASDSKWKQGQVPDMWEKKKEQFSK